MTNHLPLNGTGITAKVRRVLAGNSAQTASAASTLAATLAGGTAPSQENHLAQERSTAEGTGSPGHAPTKAPATDPSQGRGNRRPQETTDPILRAFQTIGIV